MKREIIILALSAVFASTTYAYAENRKLAAPENRTISSVSEPARTFDSRAVLELIVCEHGSSVEDAKAKLNTRLSASEVRVSVREGLHERQYFVDRPFELAHFHKGKFLVLGRTSDVPTVCAKVKKL